MHKVVPQYYQDLICPKCRKPFVFIKGKLGQVQKLVPITQKQPYCRNCGFTADQSLFEVPNSQKSHS